MSQATASLGKEGVLGNETEETGSYGQDAMGKKGAQDEFTGPPSKREGAHTSEEAVET